LIFRLSKAIVAGALGWSFAWSGVAGPAGEGPKPAGTPRELPPFLEAFRAVKQPKILNQKVTFPSAIGQVEGLLARPETNERLPAVLLLTSQEGMSEWMRQNGRELASIGYVTLVVDAGKEETQAKNGVLAEERALARMSAAVRWLRRRPDVFPEAVGVAGWAEGGEQALSLAASMPLQACVICDAVADNGAFVVGLRGTPVLAILAGKDERVKAVPAFRKALETARIPHKVHVYDGASPGFMNPRPAKAHAEEMADRAWVEIYEFLGKHVEDAPLSEGA